MTVQHTGLIDLIAVVRAEALALGRGDLAVLLPSPPAARDTTRPPRIVVAGRAGRGKSMLIDCLLGRPGLSPVGASPTTSAWIEFHYGPADAATVLVSDPTELGSPRRVPASTAEIRSYATFGEVAAPVVGVEVRVDAPVLREAVLIDTPGAGGPHAALRHAEALLLVTDAGEPIAEDEIAALCAAAQVLDVVAVAVNKSDTAGYERGLAETRRRLAVHPELTRVPVFPVSARLAEVAGRRGTPPEVAARLIELAGTRALTDHLLFESAAAIRRQRAGTQAQLTAAVARALLAHLSQLTGPAERLDADLAVVDTLLDGGGLLGARFEAARNVAAQRFAARADELSDAVLVAAEQGAGLGDLSPRLIAGLAAGAAAAFDEMQDRVLEALRESLRDDVLVPPADEIDARLRVVEPPAPRRVTAQGECVARNLDLLPTLTGLLTGSALMLSALNGSGLLGADLALVACAGWWNVRGHQLPTWVEGAVAEAKRALDGELRRRVHSARLYVADAVPRLLEARRERLAGMRASRAAGEPDPTRPDPARPDPARADQVRTVLTDVLDDLSRRSAA